MNRAARPGSWRSSTAGAELADISVSLKSGAGDGSGGLYNAVYASADTMQYSMVNLYGPYAEDKASHLETTGPIDFDFTVRYRFYTQDASYYAFARDYRQQLIDAYGLDVSYDDRPKLFLQMAGAFTVWDKFMGIPYDATVSMTTYRQALEILNDLQGIPLVANYQYGLNGGRMNTVGNKADLVAANGSRADLEELLARSSPGNEVFMEASLMRVYRKGTLFNDKRFYLTGFGGASDWRSAFNDMWSPGRLLLYPLRIFPVLPDPSALSLRRRGRLSEGRGGVSQYRLDGFREPVLRQLSGRRRGGPRPGQSWRCAPQSRKTGQPQDAGAG